MELAEQLDAEAFSQIMSRFFRILSDGVERFEGFVDKFTGDGIMALFGAPIAHEDHAQRACYAALHLREQLRRYANELRMQQGLNFSVRMGLNSGEVVVGKIGDDLRMDYTAQGHVVGLAQRMEQVAAADRVAVSEHTARFIAPYFDLRDLGRLQLKGASEPVHVFELEDAGSVRTRLDAARVRGFTRFCRARAGDGRARCRTAARAQWRDADRRRGGRTRRRQEPPVHRAGRPGPRAGDRGLRGPLSVAPFRISGSQDAS
jgi:class 3 adenylate cyclase